MYQNRSADIARLYQTKYGEMFRNLPEVKKLEEKHKMELQKEEEKRPRRIEQLKNNIEKASNMEHIFAALGGACAGLCFGSCFLLGAECAILFLIGFIICGCASAKYSRDVTRLKDKMKMEDVDMDGDVRRLMLKQWEERKRLIVEICIKKGIIEDPKTYP